MIVTVLSVLLFIMTVENSLKYHFSPSSTDIENAQRKTLNYQQLWKLSAYSITLSTIFFTIMRALVITVPSEFLVNWFVNFIILFLVLKEIPRRKTAV